jgi:soluble lytic murein transglycosylase-like protein
MRAALLGDFLMTRLLRTTFAAFALFAPAASSAGAGVYAFVDRAGEWHLSNIPDDERYERLDAPAKAALPEERQAHERRPYGAVVSDAAARYGLEPALLHAVISVESGYNARAVSRRGAAGLMQLMPQTAKRFGVADVFDPADNVRGGALYLAELLRLFDNDLRLVLAAYNAGEAAVLKYGKRIPPYRETAAYVPRVLEFYRKFQPELIR